MAISMWKAVSSGVAEFWLNPLNVVNFPVINKTKNVTIPGKFRHNQEAIFASDENNEPLL